MILSGAGLIEASEEDTIKVHATETIAAQNGDIVVKGDTVEITLGEAPYYVAADEENGTVADYSYIYVMVKNGDDIVTEPYIPTAVNDRVITLTGGTDGDDIDGTAHSAYNFTSDTVVLVDYYVEKKSGAKQINITPDKFGGNYYLEASTLFRDTNGVDMPAEFIIPNCKIQSNFTFTMASSGDPSTFTFTMDAFPDYTRFNPTQKVLASIQIIDAGSVGDLKRDRTKSARTVDGNGIVVEA